jgi:glutaminase
MTVYPHPPTLDIESVKNELPQLVLRHARNSKEGRVSDYIPELGKANPAHFGLCLCTVEGELIAEGDAAIPFTMQSISKVIALALALMDHGQEAVFDKVGMEPTGDPFNSIVKLETIKPNKPLNPMINAGAIAVTSMIKGKDVEERLARLLELARKLSANRNITYNAKVAKSESDTADLNRALTYFMREHRVLDGDVEEILELYFKQCAIELCCADLARMGAVLAKDGKDLKTEEQLIPQDVVRICKTFMVTCGMYNASGEFAIKVGLPAKSGVSGGILAIVPSVCGLGVYGPALDDRGNSVIGVSFLKAFSKRFSLSIF